MGTGHLKNRGYISSEGTPCLKTEDQILHGDRSSEKQGGYISSWGTPCLKI